MFLPELFRNQEITLNEKASRLNVTGLCCDSRVAKPGDVFFAIAGTKDDGGKYAVNAIHKGAVAVITEKKIPLANDILQIQVPQVRKALALAATNFYGHPAKGFYLAGVTGTNGKTTLTFLLEKLWETKSTGVIGTINTRYAGNVFEATHTTPDAIVINATFAAMLKAGVQAVAMEVSSHALDQDRVFGADFDAAIFTNLTQDHLDYHQDMESYYIAKRRLFTEVLGESAKPNKLTVINCDDPYGERLAREIKNVTVRTFSAQGKKSSLSLKSAQCDFSGTMAEFVLDGRSITLKTNLIGVHNLQNIMAALLVALHTDADLSGLLKKFSRVNVPGRLERVADRNYFVDYAHTPDALKNVIGALQDIRHRSGKQNRLITVFGCGGDRDQTKRPLMGRIAAELSDVVLVTSDNPRTEDPEKIIADILPGVLAVQKEFDGKRGYLVEVDRASALKRAIELATSDDIVLVAGKGHEDYQIVGTEKRHFDDREILVELLK